MMEEPRRLLDESDNGLERALLEAGARYRTPAGTRARTLLALGLAGSATVTSLAGNASASLLAKSGWAKALAISAIGAATVIPVAHSLLDEPAEPAPSVVATASPRVVKAVPARAPAPQPEPAPEAPAVEAPKPAPSPAPRAPAPVRAAPAANPSPLAGELAALDAARGALASGDARRALTLLDGFDRSYPRARLRVEAEVLRIDALSKAGQREAARKRAQAFLRKHPNSVLASRVRRYL